VEGALEHLGHLDRNPVAPLHVIPSRISSRFGAVGLAQVYPHRGRVGPARRLTADPSQQPPSPLATSELPDDDVPSRPARVAVVGVALGVGDRRFSGRKILVRVKPTSPAEPRERQALVGTLPRHRVPVLPRARLKTKLEWRVFFTNESPSPGRALPHAHGPAVARRDFGGSRSVHAT
jgi:hypothetical protein